MSDPSIPSPDDDPVEPQGVPSGGDSLSADPPTGVDGTADAGAASGDAGASDELLGDDVAPFEADAADPALDG